MELFELEAVVDGERLNLQVAAIAQADCVGIVWRRRYTEALIGLPKRNGKTTVFGSALALFFLAEDLEPNPHVVAAATSEKQADLVFEYANRVVELSPNLRGRLEPFARGFLDLVSTDEV